MATTLEASGEYRILRKLRPRPAIDLASAEGLRTGLFVDVETTGLNARDDEIIELAMTRFFYSADGRVHGVGESFQAFREPSKPIPAEVTAITGLTDAMVAGHAIDPAEVAAFASGAAFVAAHNASFDRRFLERFCDVFRTKPWACSMSQVDWAGEGYEGVKLAYLASSAGFFYDKHRAVNDCAAAIELLSLPLPNSKTPALSLLLEAARRPTWRVRAEGAPFDLKDVLKARGYRWDDGSTGAPRAWFIDVSDAVRDEELRFLQTEIYQREVDLRPIKIDAFDRFSERC
ncbi:3'-5' exonuclease [Brevundimonas diminuta]|uniref:3'-5' exonuclease n=1 Tax=Brevundimonas diminuta TaxID=293 RepID=UPI001F58F354|nr:3'-5' exonuclease [Brevundimonas diminuta]